METRRTDLGEVADIAASATSGIIDLMIDLVDAWIAALFEGDRRPRLRQRE